MPNRLLTSENDDINCVDDGDSVSFVLHAMPHGDDEDNLFSASDAHPLSGHALHFVEEGASSSSHRKKQDKPFIQQIDLGNFRAGGFFVALLK